MYVAMSIQISSVTNLSLYTYVATFYYCYIATYKEIIYTSCNTLEFFSHVCFTLHENNYFYTMGTGLGESHVHNHYFDRFLR